MAGWLDKFQANRETEVRNNLAIRDPRDRTKCAGESGDCQAVTGAPAADAEDTCAARAYIFCERGFRPRQSWMTGDVHTHFHGNPRLATRPGVGFWDPHPKSHFQCPLPTSRPLHAPDEISSAPCPSCGTARDRRLPGAFQSSCHCAD